MKLKLFFYLLMIFMFLFSCQEEIIEPDFDSDPVEKCATVYEEGTIVSLQIESRWLKNNLLGDPTTRNVNVYVPIGYNENRHKRFPVIYLLHGQPASETSLLYKGPFDVLKVVANLQSEIDFPEEGYVPWLTNLMETGGMKKALIVTVNASNLFGATYYSNYEPFIAFELVRFIDRHFRTIPNHKARAVVGHCIGGYGALRLAIKYPYVFGNVAGLSPLQMSVNGITNCAQMMLYEDQMWGFQGPTVPYNANAPYKFITNAIYGGAAAWLPNPDNPPYYSDLPFSYAADGTVILNDERVQIWMDQQLLSLVPKYKHNMQKLQSIYFDIGLNDELGITQININLHNLMEELHISHEFETYDGGHASHLYNRLGLALVNLSKEITPPYYR